MSNFRETLGKLLALITAVVFVIALPLILILFNVGRVVFDQPRMTEITTEVAVESKLIPLVLEWFSKSRAAQRQAVVGDLIEEPDIVDLLNFLSLSEWVQLRDLDLTREIMEPWVAASLEEGYRWIDSDDVFPHVLYDLRDFRAWVSGVRGEQSLEIVYNSLPSCTDEQVADFQQRLTEVPAGQLVAYNLCQFPPPYETDQRSDYAESLIEVIVNIPDTITLPADLPDDQERARADELAEQGFDVDQIKDSLRWIRFMGAWGWLIPLGLLLFIVIFAVRTWSSLGRWSGIPLLFGALLTLLIAFGAFPLFMRLGMAGVRNVVDPEVANEMAKVVRQVIDIFLNPVKLQAGILFMVGLVAANVLPRVGKNNEEEPFAEEE